MGRSDFPQDNIIPSTPGTSRVTLCICSSFSQVFVFWDIGLLLKLFPFSEYFWNLSEPPATYALNVPLRRFYRKEEHRNLLSDKATLSTFKQPLRLPILRIGVVV